MRRSMAIAPLSIGGIQVILTLRSTRLLVKRRLPVWVISLAMAFALTGLVSTSVYAERCAVTFCVAASNSVNGGTGYKTVTYNTYAQNAGSVKYTCQLGPVPFLCSIYFVQTLAYTPFASPSVVAGNLPVRSYTVGTSSATGQKGWNYNDSGVITGNYTGYLTGRARADQRTSSSLSYWNASGTGAGHVIDENYRQRVHVP